MAPFYGVERNLFGQHVAESKLPKNATILFKWPVRGSTIEKTGVLVRIESDGKARVQNYSGTRIDSEDPDTGSRVKLEGFENRVKRKNIYVSGQKGKVIHIEWRRA